MAKGKKGGNPKKEDENKGSNTKTIEKPPQGANAIEEKVESLVCSTCGTLLNGGDTKCENCGNSVIEGEKTNKTSNPSNTQAANKPTNTSSTENHALERWLTGEAVETALQAWLGTKGQAAAPGAGAQVTATAQVAPQQEAKEYALRMWLTGEAGGDALDEWLKEETPGEVAISGDIQTQLAEKGKLILEKEKEIQSLKEELKTFKGAVDEKLKEMKTEDFDPLKVIEETADLSKRLQTEIKRRKDLEAEIEKIKKGSIAVIKYVKAQQMKIRESDLKKLRMQLKKTVKDDEKIKKLLEEKEQLFKKFEESIGKKIKDLPQEEKKLKKRELELAKKESSLKLKEQELIDHAKDLQEKTALSSVAGEGVASEELRARLEEELRAKDEEFLKREADLKKKIAALEEEVEKHKIDEKLEKEAKERRGKSAEEIDKDLAEKERQLAAKEKSILLRENEIERLKEQLKFKEDELKKLKEPLAYKEEELLRREQDIEYAQRMLESQKRKFDEAQKEGGSVREVELKKRLEEIKLQISEKEEEIRGKEKYLNAKAEELRLREQGLIEEEIEARGEEVALEIQLEKAKTGNSRLDDLLLGGVPLGSNVLIYGQAFIGKEVVVNGFIAEGLRKGVPAIWVITDRIPLDIREEMEFVVSGYQEYEKLGLVRYIDSYSKSMGEETEDQYTIYIDDPTDFQGILKAVDDVSKELKSKYKYYRLAFRTVSTLIAYLDSNTAFRFLQPFCGRRKRDKSVAMFILEKGMHSETDIQMLGSMMDGALEFKLEQLKSFMCVKGVCDVQSRAWVRYTHSKKGISIGSFALDHIR